jgi:hypothetical protein
MRMVAVVPDAIALRTGIQRLMLTTKPQSGPYPPNVVALFGYMAKDADGPSVMGSLYDDAETALNYVQDLWGVERSHWRTVADQVPGCEDDWLAPVRIFQDEDGVQISGRWQQLVDGCWVEFVPKG